MTKKFHPGVQKIFTKEDHIVCEQTVKSTSEKGVLRYELDCIRLYQFFKKILWNHRWIKFDLPSNKYGLKKKKVELEEVGNR